MSKKPLKSQARNVVYNVYCKIREEGGESLTESSIIKRVQELTGVPNTTVRRIIREGIQNEGVFCTPGKKRRGRKKKIELDSFDLDLIRNKVKEFYIVRKEIPTVMKLLQILREDINFNGGRESLSGWSTKTPPWKEEFRVSGSQLLISTGVVKRSSCFAFEMMLWRISRGNIYYRQASEDKTVKDPKTGLDVRKVAFLAVCQGVELSSRMLKVCAGFRANVYPCPKTYDERVDMLTALKKQLTDLDKVIQKTHFHRCKALRVIARQWDTWMMQVKKAKAIYHTLNLFNLDISKNCLIGQCWIPDLDLHRVQHALESSSQIVGTTVPSFMSKTEESGKPPTYHRTNKFTQGFQALINAYGDSTYRELNPGLYTVVTFPFLFGVMFGDVGHGIILLFFSLWMIIKEKQFMSQKSDNEIWNIFFGGRYVMLMLSFFSIYAGFIYNDIFSKSANFFGSYWRVYPHNQSVIESAELHDLEPSIQTGKVYWFGLDPVWKLATNQIMVENSIKMKFSIIVGIIHMMFGIVLSLFDHIYFKRYYAIYLEFIPQTLFLVCIFFWLVFMIYLKWFMYGAKTTDIVLTPGCAPQILILFIDMALLSETKAIEKDCKAYMFSSQRQVQMGLVVLAVACVPVLLFGTPLYVMQSNKRKKRETMKKLGGIQRYSVLKDSKDKLLEKKLLAELAKYNTPFGELMIHQGVSTIEYVLSTVSHTASYLRLWALSLAHAELSVMLWSMIFKMGLKDTSFYGAYCTVIFAVWASFTVSILVVMEGMSAFLHTLRLHWVEFMSKFYLGRGWPFRPFNFAAILAESSEKTDNVCKKKAKQLFLEKQGGGAV